MESQFENVWYQEMFENEKNYIFQCQADSFSEYVNKIGYVEIPINCILAN